MEDKKLEEIRTLVNAAHTVGSIDSVSSDSVANKKKKVILQLLGHVSKILKAEKPEPEVKTEEDTESEGE